MATTTYTRADSSVPRAGVSRAGSPVIAAAKAIPSQTGIWVAVSAIAMSFAALTSALVVREGSGSDWQRFVLPRILYLDTVILMASSYTLELARKRFTSAFAMRQEPSGSASSELARSSGLYWLYMTQTLGLVFVIGQFLAWRSLAAQGLFLATSPSSSFFYLLTAMHGLHLLGGVLGLLYVGYRMRRNARNAQSSLGTAAVYWHFVDLLWLYLLMVIAIRM
ncbi:MAG: cytochrome c oxidase subunit 3 [Candidatus Acidiferrales bacterium]